MVKAALFSPPFSFWEDIKHRIEKTINTVNDLVPGAHRGIEFPTVITQGTGLISLHVPFFLLNSSLNSIPL
jgi:hypothetical protein